LYKTHELSGLDTSFSHAFPCVSPVKKLFPNFSIIHVGFIDQIFSRGVAAKSSRRNSHKIKSPLTFRFSQRAFLGTQTFKRLVFIYPVELSNLVSSQPSFLIESADSQEEGQEEHPEHEVGRRPEILVDPEADVEEH